MMHDCDLRGLSFINKNVFIYLFILTSRSYAISVLEFMDIINWLTIKPIPNKFVFNCLLTLSANAIKFIKKLFQ